MPDNHEQLLPIWAMDPINHSRSEADVVLVVGSRLGETDWWGKPPYWGKPGEQKMIQVDIDQEILGLKLDEEGGCERYQQAEKIDLCRNVTARVVDVVSGF